MASWSNVHLMFCEGPHDAAFLNRLLKDLLGFKRVELKPSELPYPIGSVLQQSFKTQAAEDLRLDLAKKFFLPDYLLQRESTLVLVFNYGGSNRPTTMPLFLKEVFVLLQTTAFSSGTQTPLSYVVFADADALGTTGARNQISTDLAQVGDHTWLTSAWSPIPENRAMKQDTQHGPAAVYIWRQWHEDRGTLEDLVLECLADDAGVAQTQEFLDQRFDWNPPADATPQQVCGAVAKRLKATFCVEGQRKKPGGSLAVILDQAELLTTARLNGSESVKDCAAFLRGWLGVPDAS